MGDDDPADLADPVGVPVGRRWVAVASVTALVVLTLVLALLVLGGPAPVG